MAVSWEALAESDKYRGGCSQPTIVLCSGSLMEELEKGQKELGGLQPHVGSNSISRPGPREVPGGPERLRRSCPAAFRPGLTCPSLMMGL